MCRKGLRVSRRPRADAVCSLPSPSADHEDRHAAFQIRPPRNDGQRARDPGHRACPTRRALEARRATRRGRAARRRVRRAGCESRNALPGSESARRLAERAPGVPRTRDGSARPSVSVFSTRCTFPSLPTSRRRRRTRACSDAASWRRSARCTASWPRRARRANAGTSALRTRTPSRR